MQKVTIKKLSLLSLILMAASALSAAILPAVKSEKQQFSLSIETKDGNESSASCMATISAESDPCEDDSDTDGDRSGSTDEDVDGSDGPTTAA
ncbi:hypothetical protein FAM09_12460 [Niastella caeni]|uniref:Secreted protein n=1 Tax=Niastella caeni TaxID=2569763 RepID=A0A4S8HX28_9BACT|nr:hypothetical protein [Niastella caeni]THU39319.1 hypothetical protein FAM09_12460 [Niastella caeni]